jgi:hypothetical protein
MPMKNPPHPGDFIRTEIIRPAGLSVTAAAAALHVSRPALSSLLNGAGAGGDRRPRRARSVKPTVSRYALCLCWLRANSISGWSFCSFSNLL